MPTKPPAAVKDAIAAFVRNPAHPFTVKPREPLETSLIFDWGVRAEFQDGDKFHVGWICMADESCLASSDSESLTLLPAGRTSKATKHLRLVHRLTSDKTEVERSNKRSRDEEIERLRASAMYAINPQRLWRLLETLHAQKPAVMAELQVSFPQVAP